MFCPKCSQPQASDRVRFCSRCGLRLDAVKGLLGREEEPAADPLPPQREITTGAALMYAGTLAAAFFGLVSEGAPGGLVPVQAFFILGFALAFIITLFRPLSRALGKLFSEEDEGWPDAPRGPLDGLHLGATLMFVGALKSLWLASFLPRDVRGSRFLLLTTVFLLMVLALRPLLRAAHALLFRRGEREEAPAERGQADGEPTLPLGEAHEAAALPPARSIPADAFRGPRAPAAEPARPASVTEDTTRELGDL